jgi:hypothetical protein
MGMKQLMSLKKFKAASANDVEQQQLLKCMKLTIKAGTIWCPLPQDNIVANTPKNSNKVTHRSSSSSSNIVHAKRKILTSSSKKDLSNSGSDNEEYAACQLKQKSFFLCQRLLLERRLFRKLHCYLLGMRWKMS